MVLTGRMRTAEEARAEPRRRRAAGSGRPPRRPSPAAARSLGHRRARHPERDEHHLAATWCAQQNSPFASDPLFRYFFGDRDGARAAASRRASAPAWSSRATATSSPTTTSSASVSAQVSVVMPDKRELKAKIIGDRRVDRPGAAEDRGARPAGAAVGGLVQAQGRRVGPGDRQSVPVEPDRHARHRPRARPQPRRQRRDLRGLHPDRRGHQSGQLGRRARSTRAASSIGINTAIFSETGGYQGIGFAVPSNLARHVMDDLLKFGEVQRGNDARHQRRAT